MKQLDVARRIECRDTGERRAPLGPMVALDMQTETIGPTAIDELKVYHVELRLYLHQTVKPQDHSAIDRCKRYIMGALYKEVQDEILELMPIVDRALACTEERDEVMQRLHRLMKLMDGEKITHS